MNWTPNQQSVIDARDANLLVSAAAGSGKTAVLVERVISRILDPDHPVDIDRILVVTFTKAAASEMKERIGAAIEKKLTEMPQNAHLRRQSALIHHARITTIDSFCSSVVREYFYKIDIDPGFRVGDSGEMKLLQQDVLERLLKEEYELERPEFLTFVEAFSSDKNDRQLKQLILDVFEAADTAAYPRAYLEAALMGYEQQDAFFDGDLMDEFVKRIHYQMDSIAEGFQTLREDYEDAFDTDGLSEQLKQEVAQVRRLKADTLDEIRSNLQYFQLDRAKTRKNMTDDEKVYRQMLLERRTKLKDAVKKIKERTLPFSEEELKESMAHAAGYVKELCYLTGRFMDLYEGEKKAGSVMDYSDLEHNALRILVDEETMQPTDAALDYRQYFEEIMIDEYQDSNQIQEEILMSISRKDEAQPNTFMVGDVKQSIYGFRKARPDLFLGKYQTFSSGEDAHERKIELHHNFRSRPIVLHSINTIFYKLMDADLGGIVYQQEAALHSAPTPMYEEDSEANRTELLLTEAADEEYLMIADRIKKLMDPNDPFLVKDKHSEQMRPVRLGDIVILMRSLSGKGEELAETLKREGIDAFCQSQRGYFDALEVKTVLAYLQVIDNPQQDIPLAAVLKSGIYRWSEDMLTAVRTHAKGSLFDALLSCEEVMPEAAAFLRELRDFRKKSRYLEVHELIACIYRETGYDKMAQAMPGGAVRAANLKMLYQRALDFSNTSYRGLFQFNRYIEQLHTYEVDYGEASESAESERAVRIFTIHKSKGLEFPVVILAGCTKTFNAADYKGAALLHERYGIGIDDVDLERRTKIETFPKMLIKQIKKEENLAEEIRLLYVALTRAKEKLILTGAGQIPEEKTQKLSYIEKVQANCYLDWLGAAMAGEAEYDIKTYETGAFTQTDGEISRDRNLAYLEAQIAKVDPSEIRMLEEKFCILTSDDVQVPAKVSVSELKLARIREEGEDVEELFPETEGSYLPTFMRDQEQVQAGNIYGTAMHRVMECLDFATVSSEDVEGAIAKLEETSKLTPEQAGMVSRAAIGRFLRSDLFARMKCAGKTLHKEQPFVMRVAASEAGYDSQEPVLVQGIIDAWFEEDGKLVLVDYKTDRVESEKELAQRYRAQMKYYALALTQATGKEVSSCILYSFFLKKEVSVDLKDA